MIFKQVKYKDSDSKFDWEEVPAEDLWEDGELNERQVHQKVLNNLFYTGEWILVREIEK